MYRQVVVVLCLLPVFACTALGQANPDEVEDRQRIVAIGDIHGDYAQFVKLLRLAGLVDKRDKWVGGDAHLVQMGDIPDRGPDSRKAMDLLMKLEKSAARAGGQVTVLIGNHEAMMMTNDLRFVHPGEYASFKDRNSRARRDAYYQQTIDYLKLNTPAEELPEFDKSYRQEWEQRFPLGYVEHRVAWAPTGEYGKWVLSHPAVAMVSDTLFVHGGISPKYASMPINELNTRVRTDLANVVVSPTSILEDQDGPLWYRGWAYLPQTDAHEAALDSVLASYGVKRIVVAHTPTLPIVLPRFGGKVLMVDVGLSAHYGNGFSALEIVNGKAVAMIAENKLALPNDASEIEPYLRAAASMVGATDKVERYLAADKAALQKALQAEQDAVALPQGSQ